MKHTSWSVSDAVFLNMVLAYDSINNCNSTYTQTRPLVDGSVARNGAPLSKVAFGRLGSNVVIRHGVLDAKCMFIVKMSIRKQLRSSSLHVKRQHGGAG